MTDQTQQDAYEELRTRIAELDEAIEAMKRADTAGQIARGSLKSVEKALLEVKSSLPTGGGELATVSHSLDEIAAALKEQAAIAARAEARASSKARTPSAETARAMEWIKDATGYSPGAGRRPDRIFWIDPRSAAAGDAVRLYSSGDIADVVEVRVAEREVPITAHDDYVEFALPSKLPGDVVREGIISIEVDVETEPGGNRLLAWSTELDLEAP